ncbi:MAG: hypothetical protein HRT73_02970 [Flavobacteriales bacterium]|nr:hypothetical protein [Flavobacteriales bacterium]
MSIASCTSFKSSEEDILGNILPELIDSLNISRVNIFPPPPPPIYDLDSNLIGVDSVAAKSILEKYEQDLQRIDSVDSRLLLGVVDSCLTINWKDLEDRNYYDDNICRDIVLHNQKQVVVAKQLVLNEIMEPLGVQLMSILELNENYGDLRKIQKRKLAGTIHMSKIYFDEEKEYGLIAFETQPFYNNGAGYYILIERNHKNWNVKRIYQNWIN